MESRVKLFGHPVHPMLIVFPLGILGGSVVFDVVYLSTKTGRWADITFWMIAAGWALPAPELALAVGEQILASL